jgi:uncharacterized protein
MARKKKKGKKRSRPWPFLPSLNELGLGKGSLLLWVTAAAITLVCLVLVVKLPGPPRASSSQEQVRSPITTEQKKTRKASAPVAAAKPAAKPVSPFSAYEEEPSEDLDQRAREVDLVILQTMVSEGITAESFKHRDVQTRQDAGQHYHYQTLQFHIPGKEERFLGSLRSGLSAFVKETTLRKSSQRDREWEILVQGHPTHKIVLNGTIPSPRRGSTTQTPTLVIVIDDLGESVQQARALAQLSFPVIFSVLPHNSRTREVVELARAGGKDLLLHLPMEPAGYPYTANPGPGALFVGMPASELISVLEDNLKRVPGAIGVNNHMGSLFTEDGPGMRTILTELKLRNLFFLDSITSPRTVAPAVSRELQVGLLRRDIFLDNVQDVDLIVHQLKKAEKLAMTKGYAIAIGHPYPETIQALQRWDSIRNGGVKISSIQELASPQMVASGK